MHLKIVSRSSLHCHQNRISLRSTISKTWRLIALLVLLAGCASQPASQRPQVEDRQVMQERPMPTSDYPVSEADQATPYNEQRYQIERAEYYGRLADRRGDQSVEESINAALSAAEFYIQADDMTRAAQSIDKLDSRPFSVQLSVQQRNRYEIILAYTEYARREYRVALNRLQSVFTRVGNQGASDVDESSNRQLVDAMLLGSFCYQELQEYGSAIELLIEREALLFGAPRAETSRYIWQVINNLSIQQRQAVIESTANPLVRNRFEQSMQGQVREAVTAPGQFDQWRDSAITDSKNLVNERWSASTPKMIAVLLPISSRFGKAALAVKDGIEYQHSLNLSPYRPRLDFYDIGSNPLDASQYYAAARRNGADLIIGPLGTEYANQITESANTYQYDSVSGYDIREYQPPTILLGGDQPMGDHFSRLSMSPERQAKIVADRAQALGYVNAALLTPADDTGARTAKAFTRYWLNKGGKLSSSVSYSTTQFDHSTELKQLFNINQSEYRHQRLSRILGYKPEFAAYRRNDIDFIFMIADNQAGRIMRPQINFFSGTKIPVLATSSVYNG
ncbi:MAG: hypothetical protein HKN85_11445, partial [Gammaproteobacteria bacterium]|nr:hypothetical protein [Gammaproteobacteria bacterium]